MVNYSKIGIGNVHVMRCDNGSRLEIKGEYNGTCTTDNIIWVCPVIVCIAAEHVHFDRDNDDKPIDFGVHVSRGSDFLCKHTIHRCIHRII